MIGQQALAAAGCAPPKLAVVTVTYNSAGVLPEFLASLSRQTDTNWMLIAIDNASTDDSVEQLSAWADPRLHLVTNNTNVGFAAATNQGFRLAIDRGIGWILILNNDTSFAAGTIGMLLERSALGDAEVYAPHIVYHSSSSVTWYGGGRFTPAWGFRASLEGEGRANWATANAERWVDFAPGCCKLVSTALLSRLGLYDEDYFVYWEDVDMCWRWSRRGIRIRFLPKPIVEHDVSALTGGESSPFAIRMYHENQIIFMRKNFAGVSVILRLIAVIAKVVARGILGQDSSTEMRVRLSAIVAGLRRKLIPVDTQAENYRHGTAGAVK